MILTGVILLVLVIFYLSYSTQLHICDFRHVVVDYINEFEPEDIKARRKVVLLIFVVPVCLGILLSSKYLLDTSRSAELINVFSILVGLFLNVVVLVTDKIDSQKEELDLLEKDIKNDIYIKRLIYKELKKVYYAMTLCILLSLISLVMIFISKISTHPKIIFFTSTLIYMSLISIGFNILISVRKLGISLRPYNDK